MPWTWKEFRGKKKGMTEGQARKGASMANKILTSCVKGGKKQADCERIAIATTLKNVTKGGKRKT